jgi:Phosphodiester glycosidase/FlgD Ig-like domain
MLRRAAIAVLATVAFAAPAHAQGTQLMPGVTYEKTVQFTPHGAVVLHVITAPRPGDQNGLYQLAPALAHGTIMGGTARVTQIQKDASPQATVAGIEGDLFDARDGHPSGIVLQNGVLAHPPLGGRSSIGVDTAGALHVERVKFFGTWQGTGQRRPLAGTNEAPSPGEVVLFTPAWGAPVPRVAGSAEIVLDSFPATTPNAELRAAVTALGAGGGETIPPLGAVLMATGASAAKLQAEAPVGTTISSRLILQPAWANVTSALGGGPVLVRNGKPVFRSLEDFTNDQVTSRSPRAAVGQLSDGRVVLAAVDGRQPGYSVGLTSFELAQTLVRLGAVTASGVAPGDPVTMGFDGRLLNRPSRGERAVKEALLVEYFGVYAADLPFPLLNGEPGRTQQPLSYKIVRRSTVTAQLVGPGGITHALESGAAHDPGSYSLPFSAFDAEGMWRWSVTAVDDLGRQSTAERSFRYDTTLRGVAAGGRTIRFTLTRRALVHVQIETKNGLVVDTLHDDDRGPGSWSVQWDGELTYGVRAHSGAYVAHVFATSSAGTADIATPFAYRR